LRGENVKYISSSRLFRALLFTRFYTGQVNPKCERCIQRVKQDVSNISGSEAS
jgi:hypothetical protein